MKSPFFHLIFWLVIAVATGAGYWFWYNTVSNESVAVADLQNQINTKTEASVRVAAARTALAEISGDESLVQSYFVPQNGVVSFIDMLEGLAAAQNANMKVLSVSTGGTANQPTLLLTIGIDGTFDSVMRTVGAVEYAPYDVTVSKFAVSQTAKNAWHADLELIVGSVPSSAATSTAPTQPSS